MASVVGCDNVRDDLAAFVLPTEIKHFQEKPDDPRDAFGPRGASGKRSC